MRRLTMEEICAEVAIEFGLTMNDLQSTSRIKKVVLARTIAVKTIRKLCPSHSFPEISNYLNGQHPYAVYANKRTLSADELVHLDRVLKRVSIEKNDKPAPRAVHVKSCIDIPDGYCIVSRAELERLVQQANLDDVDNVSHSK